MDKKIIWQMPLQQWLWILVATVLVLVNFWGGIEQLTVRWDKQEEYSHGYMLPFVSLYFIWQKKLTLQHTEFLPSWSGFIVVLLALVVFLIGEVSALYILIHYALIAVLLGLALAFMGFQGVKPVVMPILLLVFAIPLPYFLEASLTAQLQLLSSELGVMFIRWCQIPVYLEGNVIDLGVYQLQVVEACSGLRYLYPLMGLGFICAYMFNTEIWKRVLLFLTTIPITLIMNSFRIGVTGVLVNSWGTSVAEGFLHDFEGWIIFIACMSLLMLEMTLLAKIGKDPRPLMEVFGLTYEIEENKSVIILKNRTISYPLVATVIVLIITVISLFSIEKREEFIPKRKTFPEFPMQLGDWKGKQTKLEDNVLKTLQLSDYISSDYQKEGTVPINFYVAYYESQRKGVSPHSPRVCIPGGGWQISDIKRVTLPDLPINRIVIKKNNHQQLVYYWFQQRGRKIANEYFMKWYLFNDALFLNRTDGALVRLTTVVAPFETIEIADKRLQGFLQHLLPVLAEYIPE